MAWVSLTWIDLLVALVDSVVGGSVVGSSGSCVVVLCVYGLLIVSSKWEC